MDESVAFYTEFLGMEQIPSPEFGVDVVWLEDSRGRQLHLFNRDVPAPRYHHFGVTVDNFEAVYQEAKERDVITDFREDADTTGLYLLPDDTVQLYLEDPSGNLLEINWPDIESLNEDIRTDVTSLDDLTPQTGEAARATLAIEPFQTE